MEDYKYTKLCPICNNVVKYKTKNILRKSNRENHVCRNCKNKNDGAYSDTELQFLKNNCVNYTIDECALLLGRSGSSVSKRVYKMGLKFVKTPSVGNKFCGRCKEEYSIDNFVKSRNRPDGLHPICKECSRVERVKNRDAKNKYDKLYSKHRESVDISYKLAKRLRKRLNDFIGMKKSAKSLDLIGCSVEYFKLYMESKFTLGMSWDTYGLRGWHIDHIKPCASFDLTDEKSQRECFHYTNLQPLWWRDNLSKGCKLNYLNQI